MPGVKNVNILPVNSNVGEQFEHMYRLFSFCFQALMGEYFLYKPGLFLPVKIQALA